MTERITRRLSIQGVVQGVWFRESMRQEAARLGITGWVRNRADGSVEAMVQGTAQAIEAITQWAQRGPEQARVERVESAPGEGDYAAFEKLPTA
jgi:acylphosphatase